MALDLYVQHLYEYAQKLPGIQEALLRDALVADRIATNSTGRLPRVLCRQDRRLKQAVQAIGRLYPAGKGIKRGVALQYGRKAAVFADYTQKDEVTGEYPLWTLSFAQLGLDD